MHANPVHVSAMHSVPCSTCCCGMWHVAALSASPADRTCTAQCPPAPTGLVGARLQDSLLQLVPPPSVLSFL